MLGGGFTAVSLGLNKPNFRILIRFSLGMAMRLAFDLGLHIDMSLHVAEGSISAAEAEIRGMVFWGAYTLDQ